MRKKNTVPLHAMLLLLACSVLIWPVRQYAQENAAASDAVRPKVGLVLGGGGAKGFAHIVVLELLEELGIPVDLIIGVSSGAIVGGLYSVGYSPAMMKDALFDLDWSYYFRDSPVSPFESELGTDNLLLRYSIERGNTKKGYSPGELAYLFFKTHTARIPSYVDFDTFPIPFRATAVEIPDGSVELINRGDLAEAIRASMGIPGIFDPFDIDGKLYMDGGTLDNLPIRQAKEMGCDIIIASELFTGPESMNAAPLEVPELILGLYFNTISREQYPLADVVLKPDVRNFSMLDFQKAGEIYSFAEGEKDRMREELGVIKRLLDSEAGSSGQSRASPPARPARGSYLDMPLLVPETITITGALDKDREYIEKSFPRLIKGKALSPESLEDFVLTVYKTGNYRFVAVRTDTRRGTTGLELLLYPEVHKRTVFLLGGSYRGTLSRDSINKICLQGAVQIEGLSGPGSVLSLSLSSMDVNSFGVLYLQPLSPRAFVTVQTEIQHDRDIIVSGFSPRAAEDNRLLTVSSEIRGGILFGRYSVFRAGPFLLQAAPPDLYAWKEKWKMSPGFGAAYTYSSLDYPFLPSKGISAALENRLYFPLPFDVPWFFDVLSLGLEGALPLGRGFSFIAGAFAGSGLGTQIDDKLSFTGFNAFDRRYFPHIAGKDGYYANMAASSLAFQFQPWKNLIILGGQIVFSLSVSAGELFDGWTDLSFENLVWSASFNTGLRLKNNFGLLFRTGAGGNGSAPVSPFVALDIGQAAGNSSVAGFTK